MKRCGLIVLALSLGLVLAAPAASSVAAPGTAHIAKKCKKGHKSASAAKKCRRRAPASLPVTPPTTTPPPAPLALTASEVINRVTQRAGYYCSIDPDCIDYGYYYSGTPSNPACSSTSTYSWSCYGWNDEDAAFFIPNATCDFREVVERSGYNGITSHRDLTFAPSGSGGAGWDCS